jgi:hypothetical protein
MTLTLFVGSVAQQQHRFLVLVTEHGFEKKMLLKARPTAAQMDAQQPQIAFTTLTFTFQKNADGLAWSWMVTKKQTMLEFLIF